MNHRCFSRALVRLEVKIRSGQAEVGHYMTRDLNHGGIGIDGDFSQLKLNAMIEVEFIHKNVDFHCKIKGMLIQHADNSIGVMFTKDYYSEIDYILRDCLEKTAIT